MSTTNTTPTAQSADYPRRVRCSPLGRRSVVADVVDRLDERSWNAPDETFFLVELDNGSRFRVAVADTVPVGSASSS